MKRYLTRHILSVIASLAALTVVFVSGCIAKEQDMNASSLETFATRYTAAWCSQNAASVAEHFADTGALTINGGTPAVGRAAITASAQGFMTAFPDMVVAMDSLRVTGDKTEYHWTLTGTNTGPGGTGKSVRISGFEAWTIGADGLIVASQGHYDAAEYERQLRDGVSRD